VRNVLRAVSLEDKARANTRFLSGGMKRRLLIAKAIVHEPRLLFLDEPTAGVDLELREELWHYVRGLRDRGTTVVLTTHYLHEAEELADRVGILRRGRLVEVDPTEQLIARLGKRFVYVRLDGALEALPAALAELGATLDDGGRTIVFTRSDQPGELDRLLGALQTLEAGIVDLETRRSSLEDVARGLMWQPDSPAPTGRVVG
jgi:ABC-2 type transport system ATP-binding protein